MGKRYRVAFSYAGERREFVAAVASILPERFGRSGILFDRFHQPEFARSDLAIHLTRLYSEEADLVVAVLCKDYQHKEWCGLEWSTLFGIMMNRGARETVMLTRFDLAEGEGLSIAGFLDLDQRSPAETAALILERLARNEGRAPDYYATARAPDAGQATDWPEVAPALDWPVADHTQARRAFAQLIVRAAPFRLLPIRGNSGTGKTHLTDQFLGNAMKIEALRCARFDFKGWSDLDAVMGVFARTLDVAAPTSGAGISNQFAQLLAALRETIHPTLLIFDTFEMAGEAERWMRDELLVFMLKPSSSWLRTIVVGQQVPKLQGGTWSRLSCGQIELTLPSPQEWLDFARAHNAALPPFVDIQFVSRAHELASGDSKLLMSMLGPKN